MLKEQSSKLDENKVLSSMLKEQSSKLDENKVLSSMLKEQSSKLDAQRTKFSAFVTIQLWTKLSAV